MSSLPTQEQIFTKAAEAAHTAAGSLSDVRDWLQASWSDEKPLTDEAAAARTAVLDKLASLKADIYEVEQRLRGGAKSLGERR